MFYKCVFVKEIARILDGFFQNELIFSFVIPHSKSEPPLILPKNFFFPQQFKPACIFPHLLLHHLKAAIPGSQFYISL